MSMWESMFPARLQRRGWHGRYQRKSECWAFLRSKERARSDPRVKERSFTCIEGQVKSKGGERARINKWGLAVSSTANLSVALPRSGRIS